MSSLNRVIGFVSTCLLLLLQNGFVSTLEHTTTSTTTSSRNYPITTLVNAKWEQTPLYLEIAEYIADENKAIFWEYIKSVTELETALNEYDTASKQYITAMNLARNRLNALQIPLLKLIVSMHSLTPRIQTHFQIATEVLSHGDCDTKTFAQLGSGKLACTLAELKQKLKHVWDNDKLVDTFDFDHVYPGTENHTLTVIVYGDIGSLEFAEFHQFLSKTAGKSNIRYIIRHFISERGHKPVRLSGYGVELHLKSTEYKSQDDSHKPTEESDENANEEAMETEVEGFDFKVLKGRYPTFSHSLNQLRNSLLQSNEDIVQLKAWEFQDLGLQATAAISEIQGEESLQILQFTAHNFPMQVRSLITHKVSDELRAEVKHNIEIFERNLNIVAPDGALFINGLFFDADTIELGTLVETLRDETRVLQSLHANNIYGQTASALLALDLSKTTNHDFAIDIRDTSILWINDIETDAQYRRWPGSVMDLMRPTFPGMLRNVRKNFFNLVLVIDPIQPQARTLIKLVESFIMHMVPIRLGVVFDDRAGDSANADDYLSLMCAFNFVTQKKDARAAFTFLTDLFGAVNKKQNIRREHIRNYLKKNFDGMSNSKVDEILGEDSDYDYGRQLAKEFVERLGYATTPQALLNGVPMQESLLTSESDFEEAIFSEIIQQTSALQKAIYRGDLTDSDSVLDYLMNQPHVMQRLNQRILGDESSKFVDFTGVAHNDLSNVHELAHLSSRDMTATLMSNIKYFTGKHSAEKIGNAELHFLTLWVIGDLEQTAGRALLTNALNFLKSNSGVRIAFIPNVEGAKLANKLNLNRLTWAAMQSLPSVEATDVVLAWLREDEVSKRVVPAGVHDILSSTELHMKMLRVYCQRVFGLRSSNRLVISNGKIFGPLNADEQFAIEDFALIDRVHTIQYGEKLRKVLEQNFTDDSHPPINSDTLLKLFAILVPRPSKTRFRIPEEVKSKHSVVELPQKQKDLPFFNITAIVDPASRSAQKLAPILILLRSTINCHMRIYLTPVAQHSDMPVKNFYRYVVEPEVHFEPNGRLSDGPIAKFTGVPLNPLLTQNLQIPENWLVEAVRSVYDLDNIKLSEIGGPVHSEFELEYLLLEGHCFDALSGAPPRGLQITLGTPVNPTMVDTIVMANLGYFQLKANPGVWQLQLREGKSSNIYEIINADGPNTIHHNGTTKITINSLRSHVIKLRVGKKPNMQNADLLGDDEEANSGIWNTITSSFGGTGSSNGDADDGKEVINIFSVASGHLYERLLRIMMVSLLKHTKTNVKFWFLKNYLSPQFTDFLPHMAQEYGFKYELVQYKWPRWLHQQTEKQRTIWGYKILFLDVLFPLNVRKIIFVDADAIVRADIKDLWDMDLGGAPYAYTPFCDSRKEMEGFRFWKQGYWRSHLMGRRYHISALYVVDLKRFRKIAAGDRLRGQYQALSQDPNSLANLDQDLPNNMIHQVMIKSLPDEWLWCQTWCSDSAFKNAKVIDLCNNPLTKEAKLTAAQRIVPEWKDYDSEIKALMTRIEDHENAEHTHHQQQQQQTKTDGEDQTGQREHADGVHNEL